MKTVEVYKNRQFLHLIKLKEIFTCHFIKGKELCVFLKNVFYHEKNSCIGKQHQQSMVKEVAYGK